MTPRIFLRIRAFTLIELLTVIAIIGILAAISIPTIGHVREQAKTAQCASGLRQLGVAVSLYVVEHKDHYPPKKVPGHSWISLFIWAGKTGAGGCIVPANMRPLNPYMGVTGADDPCKVAQCPNDLQPTGDYYKNGSTYSANLLNRDGIQCIENGPDGAANADIKNNNSIRITDIANPARFVVMAEHDFTQYAVWSVDPLARRSFHREKGGSRAWNVLFADGHVKLTTAKKGVTTPANGDYTFDRRN
ncbi:MAG: prepilin-type N-terminal cleavage/methylation domain-containing protein [Opitutaceae bacterium]|jgi:prepilin-type N-terminal cleavage/methylation domain-containing protein/prepilin-type processing-associated H-X9-DG protein|nr:prepilin-type N-terminal cleavage/methylation domain-containing protein [Opitutaceae bacterium]